MKAFAAVISAFLGSRRSRSNFGTLLRILAILLVLICVYSVTFHVLMEREGQDHSWLTGFYWTLTVMTTLGFGDITFQGDLGRLFSIVVLVSGVMFLLVILPFTFIEFFYAPWMKAQAAARAPRELPQDMRDHVIFTCHDPIARALIPMLEKYGHPYVILCPTLAEALELHEQGVSVAVGELDDPVTYRRMRLRRAAMLVASRTDVLNANITFTAREMCEHVNIIACASTDTARDVIELAGATMVLRPEVMMGQALARRVIGRDAAAHVIGESDGLIFAEANPAETELAGLTLAESNIRSRTGANVIGIWDHGRFRDAGPDTRIDPQNLLMLAGTREQIDAYSATYRRPDQGHGHVVIVGGGRVGRLTAAALREAGFSTALIEKDAKRVEGLPEVILGDATNIETLRAARAREAGALVITPHDDDINVSLTIFFRRLRSSLQIISRCTLERNVRTLHRAGADVVLSSASMAAHTIFDRIRSRESLLLAEGVSVFPSPVPAAMAGRRLADCAVRSATGCTIVAIECQGKRSVNPHPDTILPAGGRLTLIGTLEAEERFVRRFLPQEGKS